MRRSNHGANSIDSTGESWNRDIGRDPVFAHSHLRGRGQQRVQILRQDIPAVHRNRQMADSGWYVTWNQRLGAWISNSRRRMSLTLGNEAKLSWMVLQQDDSAERLPSHAQERLVAVAWGWIER